MTAKHAEHEDLDLLTFEAMNTTFYIAVTDCELKNWKDVLYGWFHYVDQEWSRFQQHNELGQLNKLETGKKMSSTPPLIDVLARAEDYRQKTNGLFSPYLLKQMQFHGYDHSFPFQTGTLSAAELPGIYQNTATPFKFHHKSNTIKRTAEGQVDLGGIGKGYAVQAAARWLQTIGRAKAGIVDGGGDMAIWSDGEKEWTIGITHPTDNNREIAQFRIKNGGIATSNIVYRSWAQGETRKHHLLNGRTGLPVETDILQATVITDDCLDAEVMAKLCFMETGKELVNILKNVNPNYSVLLVDQDEKIITEERSIR